MSGARTLACRVHTHVNALPLACVLFYTTSARSQTNDWLIVPGKRLGPITADTTRADLDHLFAKAIVQDQPVDSGEGPEPATVVFPKLPTSALAIFWRDNRMDRVMICYQRARSCKWHTQSGVSLGTSLNQLEMLNGRALQIEPWGSDVGGNITSWRGGRLTDVFGDGENNGLWLTVDSQESPGGATPEQSRSLDALSRQKRLLSSDPAVRQLHPTVTRMRLVFRGKE